MWYRCLLIFFIVNLFAKTIISTTPNIIENAYTYEPTWGSLDSRPLPEWYDQAKVGIFLHWGVYSVPSFGSEWFWSSWHDNSTNAVNFIKRNYPPGFTYQEFAKDFTAELFNSNDWAKLFKAAGAKYVVLTSKHHEGYTLWPSTYSFNWNSMDIGPHKDLIGELSEAVRNEGLTFGLYHSLYEWFNPRYIADKKSNFTLRSFVDNKVLPELRELIVTYKPDVLWSDGDWEAYDTYWKSTDFLAWLYNESPVRDTVVVNDRWGRDIPCKHGGFYTCTDRYNPGVLISHKWENAMTVDKQSWGYRRNLKYEEILTTFELIKTLVETVSCGGNILINVGPTKEGTIIPIFQERLLSLGSWLDVNGEAIYESVPWTHQNDTLGEIWYTSKQDSVYAITLKWPEDNIVSLGSAKDLFTTTSTRVQLLGHNEELQWSPSDDRIDVYFPDKATVSSNWAWSLKITNYD